MLYAGHNIMLNAGHDFMLYTEHNITLYAGHNITLYAELLALCWTQSPCDPSNLIAQKQGFQTFHAKISAKTLQPDVT